MISNKDVVLGEVEERKYVGEGEDKGRTDKLCRSRVLWAGEEDDAAASGLQDSTEAKKGTTLTRLSQTICEGVQGKKREELRGGERSGGDGYKKDLTYQTWFLVESGDVEVARSLQSLQS